MNRLFLTCLVLVFVQLGLSGAPQYDESVVAKSYSEASSFELFSYDLNDARSHKVTAKANIDIAEISLGQSQSTGELKIDNLPSGIYHLKVSTPNYVSLEGDINIEADKKYFIKIDLKPSKAGLKIVPRSTELLDAEGTTVQVGSQLYDIGAEIVARAGLQKIRIKKFGFKDLFFVVNLGPDTLKTISFDLEKVTPAVTVQKIERSRFNPSARQGQNFARLYLQSNGPIDCLLTLKDSTGDVALEQSIEVAGPLTRIDIKGLGPDGSPMADGLYSLELGYQDTKMKLATLTIDHSLQYQARTQDRGLTGLVGVTDSTRLNEGDLNVQIGLSYLDYASFAPSFGVVFGLGPGELGLGATYLGGESAVGGGGIPIKIDQLPTNLDLHLAYKWVIEAQETDKILSISASLLSGTSTEAGFSGQINFGPIYFVLNPALELSYINGLDLQFHGRSAIGLSLDDFNWGIGCDFGTSFLQIEESILLKSSLSLTLPSSTLSISLDGSYAPTTGRWSAGLSIISLQGLF